MVDHEWLFMNLAHLICYYVTSSKSVAPVHFVDGATHGLGGQAPTKCRLAPPWNSLVSINPVISDIDHFCSQNLQTMSANCFVLDPNREPVPHTPRLQPPKWKFMSLPLVGLCVCMYVSIDLYTVIWRSEYILSRKLCFMLRRLDLSVNDAICIFLSNIKYVVIEADTVTRTVDRQE